MAAKCACAGHTLAGENRKVYCTGPLLDKVQRSNMFPDCKHFVDMCCIYSPTQTLADFEMFSNCQKNDGSLRFLKMFVEKHFYEPGCDLEAWTPTDWKENPRCLAKVSDPGLKQFGSNINAIWKDLGRKVNEDVKKHPEQYSIIYIPKPFIVPSVSHREYWYWDSFWIVRGLLHCGMYETAKGMIDNFLMLVREYGFVPGCGRIYCAGRSNPPMLIMMMKSYVEVTKDEAFAIQSLPLLELEYKTFLLNHEVKVKGRTMYQYRDISTGPRPEAYREDLETAEHIESNETKEALYTQLKSACESGQEFSSRWFVAADGSNRGTIVDTSPSAIVPVELNAIVFRSGKILAEFHRKSGNTKKADEYQDRACTLVKAIRDIMWNDHAGIWLDYDLENQKPRDFFCCTNFAPLWARAFPLVDTEKVSTSVMRYIETNQLDEMYGGVPHTLNEHAFQKWDYPNSFPPMMFIVIEGLDNLGTPQSKAKSKEWAHQWVKSVYAAYKYEHLIFERYYCKEFGQPGDRSGNAKYTGYGWTIGVVFELLAKHGKDMVIDPNAGQMEESTTSYASNKNNEFIITSEANMDAGSSGTTGRGNQTACPCRNSSQSSSLAPDPKTRFHPPISHISEESSTLGVEQKFHTPVTAVHPTNCLCSREDYSSNAKSEEKPVVRNRTAEICGVCGQEMAPPHLEGGQCNCGDDQKGMSQTPQRAQPQTRAPQGHQMQGVLCACGALLGKNYGKRRNSVPTQPKPYEAPKPCVVSVTPADQEEACACACEIDQHPAAAPSRQWRDAESSCTSAQSQPRKMDMVLSEHDPSCACYIDRKRREAEKLEKQKAQMQTQASQASCGPRCSPSQTAKSVQSGGSVKDAPEPCTPGSCVRAAPSVPVHPKRSEARCGCEGEEADEPRAEEKKRFEAKMEECVKAQISMIQERDKKLKNKDAEDQAKDCDPETKPKAQDCSSALKVSKSAAQPAAAACSCAGEEDDEEKRLQDALVGHYAPLSDGTKGADCPDDLFGKKKAKGGCCSCETEDCPEHDEIKSVATAACACDGESTAAPPPTFLCPHCGGNPYEPPTKSVGTNRPSLPAHSSASGGGKEEDCVCLASSKSTANPKSAANSKSAANLGCGPCSAHVTPGYSPDNGRIPVFNKQFPLRDRDGDDCSALPDPNAGKDKKKCCNCSPEEEDQE
ncbi:hypothetical protein KR026_002757 [Drosophila bipectinata]|nr:hypothetical protein KR026_002757 [Drosophila bipectinata]